MKHEIESVKQLLESRLKKSHIEWLILQSSSLSQLDDILSSPTYRHRIQLLYYAGQDNDGDFVFRENPLTISDLGKCLDLLDNLQLLICNTRRSARFAWYMTQAGVPAAIGAEALVDDTYSAEFGPAILEAVLSGKPLTSITGLQYGNEFPSQRPPETNRFILFTSAWTMPAAVFWPELAPVYTSEPEPGHVSESQSEYLSGSAFFYDRVNHLYAELIIRDPTDPQKGRWGGKSSVDGKTLKAAVRDTPDRREYRVTIMLEVDANSDFDGAVAFFLHDSFVDNIKFEKITKRKALIELMAYESFTLGAYTEDGTMLELDLNEVSGFPPGFYYKDVPAAFKDKVQELDRQIPVLDDKDRQKSRWGTASISRGKELSATVEISEIEGTFDVSLFVTTEDRKGRIKENVAFLLHPSIPGSIRYRRGGGQEVVERFRATRAFTAGVYMNDGTRLELDLNKVKGFPEAFYYPVEPRPAKVETTYVVIVDDHRLFREGMAALIETMEGYKVLFTVSSGKELSEQLDRVFLPHIILLDTTLSETSGDGKDTAAWIRRKFPNVRVMAMGTNDDASVYLGMIRNGVTGVILKDVEPEVLRKAMETLITTGFYYTTAPGGKPSAESIALSERESKFLQLSYGTLTFTQIASRLNVSERTVDGYRESVYRKFNVNSRVAMVLFGLEHNLLKK